MGRDEERMLAQLKALREILVDPKIAEHRGRMVKTTGDGMLAEFAGVVDAPRCAVDIQRNVAANNAAVPQNVRIEFRVGIHVAQRTLPVADLGQRKGTRGPSTPDIGYRGRGLLL